MKNTITQYMLIALLAIGNLAFATQTKAAPVNGAIVLYEFDEISGNTVADSSGVGTALNLTIEDSSRATWLAGGLAVNQDTAIFSSTAATKLTNAIKASGAITIEAWLIPQNTNQSGPARIVTLSADSSNRNFTLGQNGNAYNVRLRTNTTGNNGSSPSLSGTNGSVSTDLTHVVYTRDSSGIAKLYIDNVVDTETTITGNVNNWDDNYRFGLANEDGGNRDWLGDFYRVAVYDFALSTTQVATNFASRPTINTPPSASNVMIIDDNGGSLQIGDSLTGNYDYHDIEGDIEGVSLYRWLRDGTEIATADSSIYTLVADDDGKLIQYEVTPVATSGVQIGLPVFSDAVAANLPLTIASHAPGVDAVDIFRGTIINIVFNSILDMTSINTSTVNLSNASGTIVTTLSHNNGVLTISPTALLDATIVYTVTLQPTITNAYDAQLGAEYSWSFTTGLVAGPQIIFETDFRNDTDYWQSGGEQQTDNVPTGWDQVTATGNSVVSVLANEGVGGIKPALHMKWDPGLGQPTVSLRKHLTGDPDTGHKELYLRYNVRLPNNFKAGTTDGNPALSYWKWGRLWQNAGLGGGSENRPDSYFIVWNWNSGLPRYGVANGLIFSENLNTNDLGSAGGPRGGPKWRLGPSSNAHGFHIGHDGHWDNVGSGSWEFDNTDRLLLDNQNQGWHTIEWRFKLSTTNTSNDGIWQLWFDGIEQLAPEPPDNFDQSVDQPHTTTSLLTAAKPGFNYFTFFDNMAFWNEDWALPGVDGSIWVNDVVISTTRIGHDYVVGGVMTDLIFANGFE